MATVPTSRFGVDPARRRSLADLASAIVAVTRGPAWNAIQASLRAATKPSDDETLAAHLAAFYQERFGLKVLAGRDPPYASIASAIAILPVEELEVFLGSFGSTAQARRFRDALRVFTSRAAR